MFIPFYIVYRAIDNAPTVITSVLEGLSRQTGWAWSIIGGGPSPEEGGNIRLFTWVQLPYEVYRFLICWYEVIIPERTPLAMILARQMPILQRNGSSRTLYTSRISTVRFTLFWHSLNLILYLILGPEIRMKRDLSNASKSSSPHDALSLDTSINQLSSESPEPMVSNLFTYASLEYHIKPLHLISPSVRSPRVRSMTL